MLFLVKNVDIKMLEAIVFSLVAMAIVFLMLLILVFCIKLVSLIKFKDTSEKKQEITPVTSKKLTIEDIKDEDMMVAALVATADFVEETKCKDARLVSIKEIR